MPKKIGTDANPLEDNSPMTLAKSILDDEFRTEGGRMGVITINGMYWVWADGMWNVMKSNLLEDRVISWLSDAKYKVASSTGYKVVPIKVSLGMIDTVVRCMEVLTRSKTTKTPMWLDENPSGFNPDTCIAYEDVIVDVAQSALKGWHVVIPRTDAWLDNCVFRHKYEDCKTAEAPTFHRCLTEWSAGDPLWMTVLKREIGLSRTNYRRLAKWFMHYGDARGGKGTIEGIRRQLVGEQAYMGIKMSALMKNFGLHKLATAKVLVISEVVDLGKGAKEEVGGLVKNVLGRDPIDLDIKFKNPLENVVSDSLVVMLGNELPSLSNKGRGLSSKMVPLNFDTSFEKREDFDLEDKLSKEIQGIARWSLDGAVELFAERDPANKFPLTGGAKEALWKFSLQNNHADEFLSWGFVQSKEGFVNSQLMWGKYRDFAAKMGLPGMPRTQFNNWLEINNSWSVKKYRMPNGGQTGFKGIGVKAVPGFEGDLPRGIHAVEYEHEEI